MQFPEPGKSKSLLLWTLALMTGGLLGLGYVIYQVLTTPPAISEIEQLTVPAKRETLQVEIQATGTVEPIQSVNISPKNPGRVVKLLVEQGDVVKKGQPLAVMDNREDVYYQGTEAQANLKQAIANYEAAKVRIPEEIRQAKARLIQAQIQVNQLQAQIAQVKARLAQSQARIPKEIEQANSQRTSALSRFKLAEARVNRNRQLAEENAIAQDQFDQVWNDYLDATAKLAEANQRLEQLQATQNPEIAQIQYEIAQLEEQFKEQQAKVAELQFALQQREKTAQLEVNQLAATVESYQAQLKQKEVEFRDTIVTAPFEGVVTQRYTSEGSFVTPTTSASSTASATSSSILALAKGLEIVAKVPEVDISLVKRGQAVNILADAYPDERFQGQVIRIAPEAIIENNVTSFEVTIALITGVDKLKSKMNVDVNFVGQSLENVLVVPTVAIVTQEGKTGVMVVDENNQPEFKPVNIGLVIEDKTQILSGLVPNERVFIDLPETSSTKE